MKNKKGFSPFSARRAFIKGYSMIEVMLALVILAAGVAGVYMMLKPAGINAGVQQEQKQLNSLVSGVQSAFGTTGGSYENISVATARNLKLTGVQFNGNSLVSALGDTVTLRPATVRQAHDGFDAVYNGLDSKKCLSYINAFSPQTYTILVGSSQTPVQTTSGVNEGRLVSEDQIVQVCNTSAFKNSQGQVAFRFFSPSAQSSSVVENVCSCSPRTQERKLSCGTGQAGDLTQERTSTCTGGTGSCPTEVWGSWATTANTCAGGLTPVVTPPGTPGTELCIPTTERRTQACPVGYNGSIVEERNSTCASPAANPVWGAWAVSDNSCVPNTGETYTCTPAVENRNVACPAPLMGSITQLRSSTCSHPNAVPTWGAWIEQSQNCQQACVAGQNCCQPQPDQFRDVSCPAGQYGLLNERNSSFCASASATLAWNGWQANGGGCSICPGPVTENDTPVWVPRSAPCPAGSTGSHTWEAQQTRSRIRTYDCNPAPVVLPPSSYTPWTTWSDTGVIRNELNTCVSTSCVIPAGTTRSWTVGGNTCNGPALTSPVTIASGTSRAWNDLVVPTTGTASFQCNNQVLSTTPNPGATCTAPSTNPCPAGQVRQDAPRWTATLEGAQDSLCNGSMMFPPFWDAYPSWPDGFPATHFQGEECTTGGMQGVSRASPDYCYDSGGSAVKVNATCGMASVCVPNTEPPFELDPAGYQMILLTESAGQESSPCRSGEPTYSDQMDIINAQTCNASTYGQSWGGPFCDPGSPSIVGTIEMECAYMKMQAALGGSIVSGSYTGTDSIYIPVASCSTSFDLPAYTMTKSIVREGVPYSATFSCPNQTRSSIHSSGRVTCGRSAVTPAGWNNLFSGGYWDQAVVWDVPRYTPTATKPVFGLRAQLQCANNHPGHPGPHLRIYGVWEQMEREGMPGSL